MQFPNKIKIFIDFLNILFSLDISSDFYLKNWNWYKIQYLFVKNPGYIITKGKILNWNSTIYSFTIVTFLKNAPPPLCDVYIRIFIAETNILTLSWCEIMVEVYFFNEWALKNLVRNTLTHYLNSYCKIMRGGGISSPLPLFYQNNPSG